MHKAPKKEIALAPNIYMIDYKALSPVFIVHLRKQTEQVKYTLSEKTVQARFRESVSQNNRASVVLISDRLVKLESDENRLV